MLAADQCFQGVLENGSNVLTEKLSQKYGLFAEGEKTDFQAGCEISKLMVDVIVEL